MSTTTQTSQSRAAYAYNLLMASQTRPAQHQVWNGPETGFGSRGGMGMGMAIMVEVMDIGMAIMVVISGQ
ncbi:AMY-1-associating protein expressed in testis 1 [Thecamonas trahens ATCC 50062]|uniref:AMY-1-associating protein expressed in testis 1 n=1 Tax=Thecamonas trahens ATCC 50062 TaxID=461836 RepID=A0A0L0DQB7_THETB|nr:AMY-1-associating protein expressed in testis 1 [Thecamonas trahens ATCC 50062]KNC54465.1 AMY-1-associating protein expressed in testis 1 [Thecamonas trahens ATCC 50062]|eukprot:XP_013753620.1 AMY-1-associating protein expressed in testis 1 [Thecamonas trahens ATCC 50062]